MVELRFFMVLLGLSATVIGQEQRLNLDPQTLTSDQRTLILEWEERCRATHGEEVLKEIKNAKDDMVSCILNQINVQKLQREVEVSIPRGELDLVFKKYCKKRDSLIACVEEMFDKVARCTIDEEKKNMEIVRKGMEAAIDFICHDDGDRIALFMAEKGMECLKAHKEDITTCIKEGVPEIQDKSLMNWNNATFDDKYCKKLDVMHACIVNQTDKCEDTTPSNILDSLITSVLKKTPCKPESVSLTTSSHTQHLPNLLILLAAALTAANILL